MMMEDVLKFAAEHPKEDFNVVCRNCGNEYPVQIMP